MKKKPLLKWSPALPVYKSDNIISSLARQRGDLTGFIPQYETEPKENMNFIMSNEYMKLWFKERENYEKQNYAQQQMNTTEQLKRRTVQRLMNCEKAPHRRIPVNKFINNNNEKLSNTPSKETKNIGITVNRYKIECGSSSHTNNNRIRNN